MAADGRLSHSSHLRGEVARWPSVGENVCYDASVDAVHQRLMGSGSTMPTEGPIPTPRSVSAWRPPPGVSGSPRCSASPTDQPPCSPVGVEPFWPVDVAQVRSATLVAAVEQILQPGTFITSSAKRHEALCLYSLAISAQSLAADLRIRIRAAVMLSVPRGDRGRFVHERS